MTKKNRKVRALIDIDNILVGVVDNKNRTGLYRTAYSLIERFLNNDNLDITFITNKFVGEVYKDLCASDRRFKNYKCIASKLTGNDFTRRMAISRITYKKLKRNSVGFKKIRYFITYLFMSVLHKIGKFCSLFCKEKERKFDFDMYQSLYYRIPDFIIKNDKIKKCMLVHDIIPMLNDSKKYFISKKSSRAFASMFEGMGGDVVFFYNSNYTRKDFLDYWPQYRENRSLVSPLATDEKKFL